MQNGVTKRHLFQTHVVQRAFPQRKQNGDEWAGAGEVIFASQFLVWVHNIISPYSITLVSVTGKCITEIISEIYLQRPSVLDR